MWQPHHQARVLWADNRHTLNRIIKETPTSGNICVLLTSYVPQGKTGIDDDDDDDYTYNVTLLPQSQMSFIACFRNADIGII